jgi:hypothetical protein
MGTCINDWRYLLSTPLFLPFLEERLGGGRRASSSTRALSLSRRLSLSPLPGEGLSRTPIREQTGWVDETKALTVGDIFFPPLFFSPF